jgi:hypothetical protein
MTTIFRMGRQQLASSVKAFGFEEEEIRSKQNWELREILLANSDTDEPDRFGQGEFDDL